MRKNTELWQLAYRNHKRHARRIHAEYKAGKRSKASRDHYFGLELRAVLIYSRLLALERRKE